MRRRHRRLAPAGVLATLAVTLIAGCGDESQRPSGSALERPKLEPQPGWEIGSAPVIPGGALMNRGLWSDPCVLVEDGRYVMYMTSSTHEPFKPPVVPFRAVSDDGMQWSLAPQTPLLSPDGTPFVSIETPSVVKHDGVYHMYFTGIMPEGTIPTMAIGHATSPDGVSWTLQNGGRPIIVATGDVMDWNGFLVAEPGAVVLDGRVHLYFTAMGQRASGKPPQEHVIALATSEDGYSFGDPAPVLAPTSLYPPEAGYAGYSTPEATLHDGRVHLFFDVALYDEHADPQWMQVALHHAVSDDGRTFQQDAAPILTREHLGFPEGEVLGPSAIIENGTVRMWFQGRAGARAFIPEFLQTGHSDKFGIRHATIELDQLLGDD